jgi:type VI secretion system protein ImpC
LLEAILHHPEFQALEASWRGVYFLVSQLDTGSDLKIYLLDFTKEELASDLSSSEDLSRTALYRAMVEETVQTPGATPWALLAGNYVFDLESGDIEVLDGSPRSPPRQERRSWLPQVPALVGCESLAVTPDPDDWSLAGGTAVSQAWEAVRHLPEASSLGLILPRFLLRLPYGKKADPIESLPFEELSTPRSMSTISGGNPCFAAALLLARTFTESGWQFLEGIQQDIEGLPLHVFEEAGESVVKPCAEVLMTQRAAEKNLELRHHASWTSMKGEDQVVRSA